MLAVELWACSGSSPSVPDGGFKCTGAVYDLCNDEHDCTIEICQEFATEGFQVCTTACSATMPCPKDSKGNVGTCDATLNLCYPSVPNACHL